MEPQPDVTVRSVNFVRTFPWLRISQAVGCALAPQQVLLGVAAALVLALLQMTIFHSAAERPLLAVTYAGAVALPLSDLVRPVADIWQPLWLARSATGFPLMRLVEAVAVFVLWTLVGVAIARCAAIQFCRDENPSFAGAANWSIERAVDSLTAILTPLGGAAVLLGIAALLALPQSIPALGTLWMQLAAPVQFVLGAAAGFILLLLPVLWPLMVAAVAVDSSDAFDAFSRSFSLVTSKLWSTLALVFLTGISAIVLTLGFRLLLEAGAAATVWAAAWTTTQATTESLAGVLGWWREVAYRGLCASLFWTHAVMVYVFLREQVDAVPMFRLAGFTDDHRPHELYPVVGMPAVRPAAAPAAPLKVAETEPAEELRPEIGGEG
jgi:hypothetical protein